MGDVIGDAMRGGSAADVTRDARADPANASSLDATRRRDLTAPPDALDRVRETPATSPPSDPASAGGGFRMPYTIDEREAKSSTTAAGYDSYAHSFAGMGVQFILLMGVDLGLRLLAARRLGLWQRLRAAPLSRGFLLGSQVASGAVIGALMFAIILAAGIVVFGVRVHGSVVGFVALIVSFALMTASFGLFIAAIGRTPEATRGLAIFATLLMVMLGGAWIPAFIFPKWLQTASLAMPTRWAVDGFDAMTWRGLGLEAAWQPTLVLLGFAAAFASIAIARFDWDEKTS